MTLYINKAEGLNEEKPQDMKVVVRSLIKQLEEIDTSYFSKDRQKQMKMKLDEITVLLDEQPVEFGTERV